MSTTASTEAARVATIMAFAETKGQEEFAMHLAKHIPGWSLDQVRSRLRGEPASVAAIAALHAKAPSAVLPVAPPVHTANLSASLPPMAPTVAPVATAVPAIALTADSPPVDAAALWDAALRSRGFVLQADALKTGIAPATPTPPAQVVASTPPDWAASLRSRGMEVA